MNRLEVHNALRRAVAFLAQAQLENGEFKNYMASRPDMGGELVADGTVWTTIAALYALQDLESDEVERIRRLGRRFLMEEMVSGGTWRYWTREHLAENPKFAAIPPDIDDTSYTLLTIGGHMSAEDVESGRAAVRTNRDEQGRFFTWIPNIAGDRNDVDSVMNANALTLLGDCEETAAAARYLVDLIEAGEETGSLYYIQGWASLDYAVARAIGAGVRSLAPAAGVILERLRNTPDLEAQSTLSAALEVNSLLSLDAAESALTEPRLRRILQTQQEDGSWYREGYYIGPLQPAPITAWFGSEEMTTALCIEGLAAWLVREEGHAIEL